MNRSVALVTGACGEMGRQLIPELATKGVEVVALDLMALPEESKRHCIESVEASILDFPVLEELFRRHRPTLVFHLAAILSSKAEADPDLAHRVNVDGTYGLFRLCRESLRPGSSPVRFLFPSSIAVYGLPDAATKARAGALRETEWAEPAGIYGCNKHYCEQLGSYLSRKRSSADGPALDFRAIRFPGLLSAETLPSGGTTDYGPEMIHAAAQGRPYSCFVEERTRLPFMTMPDAVEGLVRLAHAEPGALSTRVYNIRAFSASAGELRDRVLQYFPQASIDFRPVPERQAIVDSWPADLNDELARRDWGFKAGHGLAQAYERYLVPALRRRYAPIAEGRSRSAVD